MQSFFCARENNSKVHARKMSWIVELVGNKEAFNKRANDLEKLCEIEEHAHALAHARYDWNAQRQTFGCIGGAVFPVIFSMMHKAFLLGEFVGNILGGLSLVSIAAIVVCSVWNVVEGTHAKRDNHSMMRREYDRMLGQIRFLRGLAYFPPQPNESTVFELAGLEDRFAVTKKRCTYAVPVDIRAHAESVCASSD